MYSARGAADLGGGEWMAGSGVKIEGFIETLTAHKVAGWAWEVGSDRELVLQVYADDALLGETVAGRFRKDLAAGGKGTGQHAFEYLFKAPMAEFGRPGAVRVTVRGTDRVIPLLGGLANKLAGGAPPVAQAIIADPPASPPRPQPPPATQVAPAPPPPPIPPEPEPPLAAEAAPATLPGVAPRVDGLTLRGGALSGRATLEDRRTLLLVTADGAPLGEAVIGDAAARAADPLLGPRGFRLLVPAALMDGADHHVALFDAASGHRLEGGAMTLRFPLLEPAAPPLPVARTEMSVEARGRIVIVTTAGDVSARAVWLAGLCRSDEREEVMLVVGDDPPAPSGTHVRSLSAATVATLVGGIAGLAGTLACSAVIVSPPRFPTLLAGVLLRRLLGCALIVDIDPAASQLGAPGDAAALEQAVRQDPAQAPSGPGWAGLTPGLIGEADGIIVANPVLRRRSGGMMVRQGRDEQAFDPARHDRARLRADFGYRDADRVILLYGALTLRDGIVEIADALERVADSRLALCVVGSLDDPKIEQRLGACKQARIALHPQPPALSVPELLAMADCVAVLQPATQADIPARVPPRLVDALAMDVPVLATSAPPLQDLAAAGAVQLVGDPAQLDAALRSLAAAPAARRNRARAVYLAEYSQSVNAARLRLGLQSASPPGATDPPNVAALFRLLESVAGVTLPDVAAASAAPVRRRLRRGEPARDLVFLASGNDSDLYGSRADMIAAHLLSAGKVRRILHFDARLSAAELESQAAGRDGDAHRGSLIYAGTVRRVLGLADTPGFLRRTFLHRGGKRAERLMGRDLPPASAYLDFVLRHLRELEPGLPPLLWVSGGVADYAMLRKAIEPALVVADLEEDPLVGPDAAIEPYEAVLADADIVFCSTDALLSRLRALRADVQVIANGAEGVMQMWEMIEG